MVEDEIRDRAAILQIILATPVILIIKKSFIRSIIYQ